MHTLNTYMVLRDGAPYVIGNTPGADYQVQVNMQVLCNVLDFGLDAAAALDAPRWGDDAGQLLVEEAMPEETQRELARRGHAVTPMPRIHNARGRAQLIVVDQESGALTAASDPRGEGSAAGW